MKQKEQLRHRTTLLTCFKVTQKQDPLTTNQVILSVDLDTHYVSVDETHSNRKTEINPVGKHVRFFASFEAAYRLKQKFDRFPYLVDEYLKSH